MDRERNIGIVGLGYVGLPLAVAFAEADFSVIGVDADPAKLDALDACHSYVEGVPSERLGTLTSSGRLRFTVDYAALDKVDTVIMCLPTPLNEHQEPDTSALVSATWAIAPHLRDGALVVLESTSYPGTVRQLLLPILQKARVRGGVTSNVGMLLQDTRQVGKDFCLAFSPERIDPVNQYYTLHNTPKIVGGVTPECTRRTAALYREVVEDVRCVSTPEIAETAKLLENAFRAVNIALINEFATVCNEMDVDVWEVIEAARTKPFGFMPFYPGPGPGGHCIPVDPLYLSWRAQSFGTSTDLIDRACAINAKMPYYSVGRILEALHGDGRSIEGSRVLLVGASYKPNISDSRESPSITIVELLSEHGVEVAYHDPHVPHLPDLGLSSVPLTSVTISRADCVVIATDHDLVDLRSVIENASRVIDLRNAIRRRFRELPDNVEVL